MDCFLGVGGGGYACENITFPQLGLRVVIKIEYQTNICLVFNYM